MTKQDIKRDICEYISNNAFQDDVIKIDCSKNLFTDYGFDSITIIEMILYLEERYNIEFDLFNVDFVELKTIDNICDNTYEIMNKKWSKVC